MSLILIKLAVKDPDTADQVLLSNIMDGVDGAAAMGWAQEEQSVQIENNQKLEHSTVGTLDVKVLRASDADITLLNGFAGSRCEVSGWTLDGFLLFSGTAYVTRNPDFNSAIVNDQIRLTVAAPKGFTGTGNSRLRAFYGGRNAIMLHDIRSSGGAANSVLLSGFTKVGTPDTTVTSEKQTVDGADTEGVVSAPLYFPFEGTSLIVSATVSTTPADGEIGIRFLEDDGTTIVSTSTTSFTTGGRKSHTATVPSGAYYMQFILLLEEIGSIEFTLPAIKTLNSVFEE